jgi:hypothetical protein
MSNQYPVHILILEDDNTSNFAYKEAAVVPGYINLDEVLDYYAVDSSDGEVTVVTYFNGMSRLIRMSLEEFNNVVIKYKNSQNKLIINRRLN